MRNVLLVGAGYIAGIHAQVLRGLANAKPWAVTDRSPDAAKTLASQFSIERVFPSLESAIASGEVACAHVLTPPDQHFEVVSSLLKARIPVFVEKPIAISRDECEALVALADDRGVALGVNHNLVFHPAYRKLERVVATGALGRIESIEYTYAVGLRQLAAKQFGHWMFRSPVNLLLEQAVHPLSQIVAMLGGIEDLSADSGPPLEISAGQFIYPSLSAALHQGASRARLDFSVGRSFPVWQMRVEGTDGIGIADMVNNRAYFQKQTRWLEPVDQAISGARTASAIVAASTMNLARFGLSTMRLIPRSDPFFLGMRASIAAFHEALDLRQRPPLDGRFGSYLVALCESIGKSVPFVSNTPKRVRHRKPFEVAVIDGTGFIGTHVVEQLLARGCRIGILARSLENLPAIFDDERVTLLQGDARLKPSVEGAIGDAKLVVNLAHGGGGGQTYEALRAAMVGSTQNVAQVCLEHNVDRLIHVGSIASLYLGNAAEVVTGATPVDSQWQHRADYARAKAETDNLLLTMVDQGLRACLLRPGVVVGRGGTPLHSALGFFNNDQHCIGWSLGRTPMPFVLADDVADVIVRALFAQNALDRTYNIVGDVRLTAREYMHELAHVQQRPLIFHPQMPTGLWASETAKWAIKRLAGRNNARPTLHDFQSRTLLARFDCTDIKKKLGWSPEADRDRFIRRGICVYGVSAI